MLDFPCRVELKGKAHSHQGHSAFGFEGPSPQHPMDVTTSSVFYAPLELIDTVVGLPFQGVY